MSASRLPTEDDIGSWHLDDMVGDGRSGTVYAVHETVPPYREGALKLHRGIGVQATEEEFLAEVRFSEGSVIREYRLPVLDRGTWDGSPYYVMPFAVKIRIGLGLRQFCKIALRLVRCCAELHDEGYVHCDIKPDNVRLFAGEAVLLDYCCLHKTEEAKRRPERVGSWRYMAPEVRDKRCLDERADVYSLAVTLYAFGSDKVRRIFGPALLHAMENDPNKRTPSMNRFFEELVECKRRYAKSTLAYRIAAALAGFALIVIIVMEVFEARLEDTIIDRDKELIRRQIYRKAAAYEKHIGDAENARRNEAIAHGVLD